MSAHGSHTCLAGPKTAIGRAAVTARTGLGWVPSYAALRQLALSAGMPVWAAAPWPRSIDLFVFVATLAAIVEGATNLTWHSTSCISGSVMCCCDQP